MKKLLSISLTAAMLMALPASAESQLSFYGGHQSAPHSTVTANYGATTYNFTAGWDGKPFAMPPYYGIRYTHWLNAKWGVSLDFAHSKVYADAETLIASGFPVLEFTDGINVLTVNATRRFSNSGKWTPYLGSGIGIAVPHVEVQGPAQPRTFEYQYGGPVLQLVGGIDYSINNRWSVFGEFKSNYVMLDVDLDGPAGSSLQTNIITNAFNLGVSYNF